MKLKAIFPNTDNMLFPNQFVNARLLVDTIHEAVLVPTPAVQQGPKGTYVYVVGKDSEVEVRNVTVGASEADETIITGGLSTEELVVVDGVDKLRQGTKVALRDAAPAGGNGPAGEKARAATETDRSRKDRRAGNLMNPSRPFILRPVATVLLMAAILLAGIVAYYQLPVSALPQVDYPTIQVVTFYPGASPDVMASSVTSPLERQFGQVPGLNQMTSNSSEGCSVITLQFILDLNIDVAEQQVQAAINAASTFLPRDLPVPPIYSKTNPADAPILTLALTSATLPLSKVQDFADTRLAQKISQLSGVGLVSISGGQKPAVRVQGKPHGPLGAGAEHGGSAHGGHASQRQPGEGKLRWEPAGLYDRRQRSTVDQRAIPKADHRLSQRRAGVDVGHSRRGRRGRELAAGRLDG